MSSVVFWQSVWYVFSFYITWLPYLALQYLWASGSLPPYGFVVFASTLVPLQGFWNCVVYFRIRAKKFIRETASRFSQSAPCLWFNAKKSNDIHGHESSAAEFDAKGGDANVAKPYTTSKIQTPVTNVNSDAIGHETPNEKIDVSCVALPDVFSENPACRPNESINVFDVERASDAVEEDLEIPPQIEEM